MPAEDSPTPARNQPPAPASPAARLARAREIVTEAGRPVGPLARPSEPTPPAAAEASSVDAEPEQVAPLTRLAFARLAAGGGLHEETTPGAKTAFGSRPFTRVELAGFGAALIGATLVGVALPQAQPVQARPVAAVTAAAAPAVAAATPAAAAAAPSAPSSDTASPATDAASPDMSAADDLATPASADDASTADPSSGADDPSADDTSSGSGDDTTGTADDGSDPLASSGTDHLSQVALVIVHGDAPIRWRDAAAGTAARLRAATGTTLTGFAQLPGAPLATELGLIAGQAPNPATRAGCDAPTPLAPGTIDDLGRVAGVGCDYPAGTPSLPTAVAVDGRRWKAYAPVDQSQAASALCGSGTPTGAAIDFARSSALRRLSDLTTSGACDGVAAPLTSLATDLASDDAPAWLVIEVGSCGADGCDATESAARDRDLDGALATLTAKKGLAADAAVIVVGDGAVDGLAPADAGTFPKPTDDPDAPAAVTSGALLLGKSVAKDATDPLAIDPYAIARTQATWLGLDAPGWAKADGEAALAVPGA